MSKKKYRIYKAGGAQQGAMMNPTAQFLARAQQGMQQPSPEEMQMMEQQAMQQQEGGQDQMMQQLVGLIGKALQNGAQPEEVVAKLLQDQIEPAIVAEALVELGMPPQEVDQLISSVMQGPQGGEEQMSEEEMMAMQQQQMAEQAPPQEQPMEEAPMSKGGYVKKRLKMAQEGMEQSGVKGSNTNLAAEDGVNNVAPILQFAKNNALKNQYEQEYDQMQTNQEMMPEARLGREARQERRGIRQDARTERTEMRQDARTNRQAARLANRALRQVSSPFGRVPGFSPFSPSPFMGGSMRLEDVERGLFGRLKNFKMSIDGLGFPSRFSEGMFINGLYNPYGMPGGQRRIVTRLQTPGEESFDESGNTGGNTGGAPNPNTPVPEDGPVNPEDIITDPIEETPDPQPKNKENNTEEVDVLETESGDKSGSNNMTYDDMYGATALSLIGAYVVYRVVRRGRAMWVKRKASKTKGGKVKVTGKEVPATSAEIKRAKKFSSINKSTKAIRSKYNSPAAKAVRNHPINRPRTPGGQLKPYKAPNYKYPSANKVTRHLRPKASWARRNARRIPFIGKKFAAPLLLGSYMYDMYNNFQDGGYVDMMDQDYGNPDLYKFTGGGDYDYFADGGYSDNGGEYEPFKSTYQGPLTEADQTSLDDKYATTVSPQFPFAPATKPNYRTILSDEEAQENEAYRRKVFENYARSGSSDVAFESNRGNKSVGYTGYNDNTLRDAEEYAYTDMNSKEGQILKTKDDMEYYTDNNLSDTFDPAKDEKYLEYRKKLSTLRSQAYGGSAQPQYENVYDPYMPSMEYGGYVPMAYDGYTVEEDDITGTDQDNFNETYSSSVDDRFENPTQELYQSLSPEQREMYKAEYQRRQQSGQGMQRGYGMMGYGQPRRGLFNTVMGINAPGAIQRRQYLTQMAGPTYADGTPVIGGALPEGYHLRTGSSKDGNAGIVYNTNNLRDRVFGRKDAAGNRVRVPKKTISYYFEGPNDNTPSLAGGDNAISNFKINPASAVAEEESDAKGKPKRVKGRSVKGMKPLGGGKFIDRKGRLRSPGRVPKERSSEEVDQSQTEQSPASPQNQVTNRPTTATMNAPSFNLESRLNQMRTDAGMYDVEESNQSFPGLTNDAPFDFSTDRSTPYQFGQNLKKAKIRRPASSTTVNDGRSMNFNPDYSDGFAYGGYAKNGIEVEDKGDDKRPAYNTLYPASETQAMNPNAGAGKDYDMYDPYFSKAYYGDGDIDRPEFEEVGEEYVEDKSYVPRGMPAPKSKAKPKAKAKAAKKKYKYSTKDATQGLLDLSYLHRFGKDSDNPKEFEGFEYDFEAQKKIGTGMDYDRAMAAQKVHYDRAKTFWAEKHLREDRIGKVSSWARNERDKIEKAWKSGSIDSYEKKALETRLLGSQYDENQRIEDNFYDTYKDDLIGQEQPLNYHGYTYANYYDQIAKKNYDGKKGTYYKDTKNAPTPKSKARVGVDGSDEGGVYTWDEDNNKVYEKQYGGYQEGEERYMTADEISQFMAAGGQIEFL